MREFDEKKVDGIFADFDQGHLPGVAVGIAIDGRPVYRKGFGLANMELPVVLSPQIRMRIASVSKQFTALAYMLLCEEGKAQLDDSVDQYLPELHAVTHKVTLRQLMGHVGGLSDPIDLRHNFSGTGRPVKSAELLALYREIDHVNAQPGSTWCYNNGGYLIVSTVIERITGQPLERVLRERIFEPIGMHDTLLRPFDTDFVPNSATLHMTNRSGRFEKSYLGSELDGGGGIVSTVDDMLRWLAHMDSPTVGTATTWATLKRAQTLTNGTSTGYGLGLITDRYRGVETLSHAGGVMGGNSQMTKVADARLDVIVMTNRQDVSSQLLVNKVLDTCIAGLEPAGQMAAHEVITGTFRSPESGRVIHLYAKDGQQFAWILGWPLQLVWDENDVLRPIARLSFLQWTLQIVRGAAQPVAIRFQSFGELDELSLLEPGHGSERASIVGRYASRTTGTELTISASPDGLRLSTVGRFGSADYQLECLSDRIWWTKPASPVMAWGGLLCFDSDGRSLNVTTYCNWALPFQRIA